MNETTPEVFLVARPSLDLLGMRSYLDSIDTSGEATQWLDRRAFELGSLQADDGQTLVEFMGRLCYRSWAPGLNANVSKVRDDQSEYIANIIRVQHGSVMEHANYSFVFANVSRVFTHELVRHRAGVAISQESLRFVRLTDLKVWLPDALRRTPQEARLGFGSDRSVVTREDAQRHEKFRQGLVSIVEQLEDWQRQAADYYGLDDEGTPFAYKKHITSALRRLAPIGLATTIGWTANLRTLRHVIEMRTALGAEEEIRLVFDRVASIMTQECPAVFGDYERTEQGEWVTENRKV